MRRERRRMLRIVCDRQMPVVLPAIVEERMSLCVIPAAAGPAARALKLPLACSRPPSLFLRRSVFSHEVFACIRR